MGGYQWVYRSGSLVVAANMSDQRASVQLPAGMVVLSSLPGRLEHQASGGTDLPDPATVGPQPWEAVVQRHAPG